MIITVIDRNEIDPSTIDPSTFECRFITHTGDIITVDRYGADDYSIWITDDVTKDWHGSSVRGSFLDIINELKGEI